MAVLGGPELHHCRFFNGKRSVRPHQVTKAFIGRQLLVDPPRGRYPAPGLVEDLDENVVLRGKVAVQTGPADTGGRADVIDTGAVIALLAEEGRGRFEDDLAAALAV